MPKHVYFSRWLFLSMTLAASACGGGGGSGGGTTINTPAVQSDQLVIQPIQVCDNTGFICAQMDFLETIVDKIWAQAGINVTFLSPNRLNNSTYLSTSASEFSDLSFSGGSGAFGRHPSSTRNSGPINLWFVDVIEAGSGLVQYGSAWIGSNGVLISDDIFSFNNGAGRIDVIAHEIGHNLGLRHETLGAGVPNNLMSDGNDRALPNTINDIFPDGAGLDRLTSEQIAVARRSPFLMPATGVASLIGGAAPDQQQAGGTPEASADAVGYRQPAIVETARAAKEVSAQSPAEQEATALPLPELAGDSVTVPESELTGWMWLGLAVLSGLGLRKRTPL